MAETAIAIKAVSRRLDIAFEKVYIDHKFDRDVECCIVGLDAINFAAHALQDSSAPRRLTAPVHLLHPKFLVRPCSSK